ncbi:MAG: metalloregulator ArsR/SmtB family transcription factor [Candidatus Lambdaproteobacteria bacterium]|nr:metalloregulator ArsR/SmtB family transcription factor [Candidatus Lambdaproteobacteria bacterium]
MRDRDFKDNVYGQLARIGQALASPRRLELLDLLCQGPRTVERLAGQIGMSVAATSHHLQALRGARLVEGAKQGQFVEYRLAGDDVCEFFVRLRGLGESRLAEIEQVTRLYLESRNALEPVDRAALLARVRKGEVTVLDVRPAEEYRAGHIPGARSVPLADLKRRLSELPRQGEVVAYCRGPYCVMAVEAVAMLRKAGFKAVRMEEGVADWRARDWPLEQGESST